MKPNIVDAGPSFITFKHDTYGLTVEIKWDRCANIEFEDTHNPWHACDFEQLVYVLSVMKETALSYFDGEFGVGYLSDSEVQEKVEAYEAQNQWHGVHGAAGV